MSVSAQNCIHHENERPPRSQVEIACWDVEEVKEDQKKSSISNEKKKDRKIKCLLLSNMLAQTQGMLKV